MKIRIEKYSNERLRARKARILQEARNLIGTKGVEGLTMRELADNSEVALATLYNIYGSKDLLITYAVNDFFEPIVETGVKKTLKKTSLDRLLMLIETIAEYVKKSPAYVRVVVAMYFKIERDQGIHKMLYSLALNEFSTVLEGMREEANYHDWVAIDLLADEISEQILWRLFQWSRGVVPDEHLAEFMKYSALQILVGATRGEITETIHAHLKKTTRKLVKIRAAIGAV